MHDADDRELDPIDDLVDRGRAGAGRDEPLGSLLAALQQDAGATTASPSPALASVLADGLPAEELVAAAAVAAGASPWRHRVVVAARVLVTKFAALGLLAKAATAGAAVTLAASGAGVAGVLPAPAQAVFDDVVGRDGPSTDEGPGAAVRDVVTDRDGSDDEPGEPIDGGSATELPSDAPTDAPTDGASDDATDGDEPGDFGERVSGDATGETDGEPGVDGREVSSEASDGRSEQRGASSEAGASGERGAGDGGDATGTTEDGDATPPGTDGDTSDEDGDEDQHGDETGRGRGEGQPRTRAPASGRGG